MFRRDGDGPAGEQSARPASSKDGRRIVHPRCMTNNAYKSWHPADEKEDSANSSRVTRGEHPSWLARLRFSLFHRWSEK
jgi:hypothetical protein